MTIAENIGKHLREVYFGGNWTASNLKDQIADVTWNQAVTQIQDLNTIATLVYHLHYYVQGVTKVFEGGPLETKDELSFDHPPIQSKEDWDQMLNNIWKEADEFASYIEKLPDEKLQTVFVNEKYGIYFRNINGIIEHIHYHLGQIVILKKLIQKQEQ